LSGLVPVAANWFAAVTGETIMTSTASTPAAEKIKRRRGRSTETTPDQAAASAMPSKLDTVVALLSRPEGASLADLVAATGWQPHSVRGALAGALKRKGHAIASEKRKGERRYRIGAGQ